MQLRDLKPGTQLSPEITIQSALDAHRGIASYLATNGESGHCLVHLVDAKGTQQAGLAMQCAADFARDVLGLTVDYGTYQDSVFYAEPFPLGEFMFEWLERKERVNPIEALKRSIELLRTLIQAHALGITHGRITPKTVLFEQKGIGFGLRLMGLGVTEALPTQEQLDIDWFDYGFDLEGMSKTAVDIYGVAIVLMGLVSGESGIDGFEATGLLPQALRGGLLQQAMERALALRIEAYQDILSFCKDLEVALLELDAKQGEMYVGDLVGFEAAIRSISPQSEQENFSGGSGIWSALVDPLEHDERSSLLYSLTSLQAIRGDEAPVDAEVTNVTSAPQSLHNMRRIRSRGTENTDLTPQQEEKTCVTAPPEAPKRESEALIEAKPRLDKAELHSAFEELKKHEALSDDDDDDEDDAPTRVMMRPNYATISHSDLSSLDSIDQAIQVIDITSESEALSKATIRKRIMQTEIIEASQKIGHDFQYPEDGETLPVAPKNKAALKPQLEINTKKAVKRRAFSKAQVFSLILLLTIIIALLVVMLLKS